MTNAMLFSLAIKASVILIAAFLAAFSLRRASASARRFVWVIAAASLVALPLLSIALPPMGVARAPIQAAWASIAPAPPADSVIVVNASPQKQAPRPIPWIPLIWSAGAFVVLAHLAAGMARMSWLARKATSIDPPEGTSRIADSRVQFLASDRIAMPMTCGIFRPKILLPSDYSEWPPERLRLVVAHELIHVAQRDCLIQLLMQAACALYWFHPLIWFGAAQFRRERERACDDGVIRLGVNGPEYAGHLLELVRSLKPGARPALAVAMAHQSNLETRLMALLDAKVSRKKLSSRAALVSVLAVACLLLPLASVRAQAPGITGIVSGLVSDPSGAVIPNASVLLTNLDTKTKEMAVANPAGEFTFKAIPAGHYTMEVSVPGFKVYRRNDVVLNANENPRLDAPMEIGNISERIQVTAQKPAGQTPQTSARPRRIRVGGNVSAARLIHRVLPTYPEYAKAQGIEGPVLLQAIISKTGDVLSLKVINSADPDLAREATNAVQQWRYEPTLLNGEPVEVVTTVTVEFRLQSESSNPR